MNNCKIYDISLDKEMIATITVCILCWSLHSVGLCTMLNIYKKMCYECQWDNSPSKSQFIKVNNQR